MASEFDPHQIANNVEHFFLQQNPPISDVETPQIIQEALDLLTHSENMKHQEGLLVLSWITNCIKWLTTHDKNPLSNTNHSNPTINHYDSHYYNSGYSGRDSMRRFYGQ